MEERKGAITMHGLPLTLAGSLIKVGDPAPAITLLGNDMQPVALDTFKGRTLIISVVPSLDTPVCDLQTRTFNQRAIELSADMAIVTVSMDLPFAQKRWCGAAGVERVQTLSDHREAAFGLAYGLLIKELRLLARAVLVVDKLGVVRYVQLVPEVSQEPDYAAVLEQVRRLN